MVLLVLGKGKNKAISNLLVNYIYFSEKNRKLEKLLILVHYQFNFNIIGKNQRQIQHMKMPKSREYKKAIKYLLGPVKPELLLCHAYFYLGNELDIGFKSLQLHPRRRRKVWENKSRYYSIIINIISIKHSQIFFY